MRNKIPWLSILEDNPSHILLKNNEEKGKTKRLKCYNKEGLTTAST